MASTVKIQVTLSEAVYSKLVEMCESSGVAKSALLAIAVSEKYEREKGGAQK